MHSKHRSVNVRPAHCPMAEVSRAHTSGKTWKVTLVLNGQWGQGAGSPACEGIKPCLLEGKEGAVPCSGGC